MDVLQPKNKDYEYIPPTFHQHTDNAQFPPTTQKVGPYFFDPNNFGVMLYYGRSHHSHTEYYYIHESGDDGWEEEEREAEKFCQRTFGFDFGLT